MRNHVRASRGDHSRSSFEEGAERELALAALAEYAEYADEAGDGFDDAADTVRLFCPDCGRPITVYTDQERLPEHALCPTPWNPFGLTVCAGSGRAVDEAKPVEGEGADAEQELAVLLTLPAGLDWRTQPFSHVGGPASRPIRDASHAA